MYAVIDSTSRKITKNYAVVNGTTRKITKMYAVVDGVTRLIFDGKGMVINPVFNGAIISCGGARQIYVLNSGAWETMCSYNSITPNAMLSYSGEYYISPGKTDAELYKWNTNSEEYDAIVSDYSMTDDFSTHTLAANGTSLSISQGVISADGSKALVLANRKDSNYGATYGLIYDLSNDTFVVSQVVGNINSLGVSSSSTNASWSVNKVVANNDLSVIVCDYEASWKYSGTTYYEDGYSVWVKSGSNYTKILSEEVDEDEFSLNYKAISVSANGKYITVPSSSTEDTVIVYYRDGINLTKIGSINKEVFSVIINEELNILSISARSTSGSYLSISTYALSESSITSLGSYTSTISYSFSILDESRDRGNILAGGTNGYYDSSSGQYITYSNVANYKVSNNTSYAITSLTQDGIAVSSNSGSATGKYIGI